MHNRENYCHQIREIISKNGKIIGTRLNKKYFTNIKNTHLYEYLIDSTKYAPDNTSFMYRLLLLEHGFDQPVCKICGAKHSRITIYYSKSDAKVSDYCSDTCRNNDPIVSRERKSVWNNIDKNAANEKRSITMLDKYGVEYNSQREDVKEIISNKLSKKHISNINALDKIDDPDWIKNEYCNNGKSASEIANYFGIYYGTVIDRLKQLNIPIRKCYKSTIPEQILVDYISSIYNGEIIRNTFDIIGPKELDIFIPEFNFAIEHNGLYSHTYDNFVENKIKYKHKNKAMECKNIGITLFQIPGNYMYQKFEIVKSIISSKLKTNEKIYARKCELITLSKSDEKTFFNKTHLHGFSSSSLCLGLKYEDEIVCAMSFGKSRFDKQYEWELIRFSTKLFTSVVGGFSKLLSNAFDYGVNKSSLVSYCDFSISNGETYLRNGFKELYITDIDYYWSDKINLFNRYGFSKNKLHLVLDNYNESLSEFENMFNNKYRVYYGCGNIKYVYSE